MNLVGIIRAAFWHLILMEEYRLHCLAQRMMASDVNWILTMMVTGQIVTDGEQQGRVIGETRRCRSPRLSLDSWLLMWAPCIRFALYDSHDVHNTDPQNNSLMWRERERERCHSTWRYWLSFSTIISQIPHAYSF